MEIKAFYLQQFTDILKAVQYFEVLGNMLHNTKEKHQTTSNYNPKSLENNIILSVMILLFEEKQLIYLISYYIFEKFDLKCKRK